MSEQVTLPTIEDRMRKAAEKHYLNHFAFNENCHYCRTDKLWLDAINEQQSRRGPAQEGEWK